MREGPENRYNRIQRELLSEIISRFPEFPDATKSVSAYLNTLMQRSPERLLEAGEGAATLEERKAKGIGFWSFMWLGHQIAKGMVKGEVMGAVVAPCAEFLPEFDYFLRKSLTDMFGEGVETHTPIAVSNKTGCVVPLAVALVGVCAVAVSVSKWCS